jgi:ferredoxin
MIKAKIKPIHEIQQLIGRYNRMLTIGCGGCVSVCPAGGLKETKALNAQLQWLFRGDNSKRCIDDVTVERQCNPQYLEDLDPLIDRYDCLLSMACGAGVQLLAERHPKTPVFPALNTMAIGIDREIGVYEERCRSCGECVLGYTAGICPVTRCAKSLFNGPCGGTNDTQCEVGMEIPCAWHEIYHRLEEQKRLEDILNVRPPMMWQNTTRRMVVQEAYARGVKSATS